MRACLIAVNVLAVYQLLVGAPSAPALGEYFFVSQGAALLKVLTGVSTLFVLSSSGRYLKEHHQHTLEYPVMIALAL